MSEDSAGLVRIRRRQCFSDRAIQNRAWYISVGKAVISLLSMLFYRHSDITYLLRRSGKRKAIVGGIFQFFDVFWRRYESE